MMYISRRDFGGRGKVAMSVAFFPRSRLFWICHIAGWLTLITFSLALAVVLTIIAGNEYKTEYLVFNLSASFFTAFILTLASLLFIQIFYHYGWQSRGVLFLVGATLSFAVAAGFVTALLTGPVMELFSLLPEWYLKTKMKGHLHLAFYNGFINTMIQSIWLFIYVTVVIYRKARRSELGALQLQTALKDAQLNTLIGQINPHFIFNALNNIRSLTIEDGGKAQRMITVLSDMLRFSLGSGKRNKVTVAEEMELVRNYIALSSIQFERRLRYTEDIADSAYMLSLPPMILQMLVENAIKHGIGSRKHGGELRVQISVDDNRLYCEVRNDGSLDKSGPRWQAGVGLRNIRDRLKLQYGGAADFQISEESGQVSARLILPKEQWL
jgi:two-component system LytT family sensor kinase